MSYLLETEQIWELRAARGDLAGRRYGLDNNGYSGTLFADDERINDVWRHGGEVLLLVGPLSIGTRCNLAGSWEWDLIMKTDGTLRFNHFTDGGTLECETEEALTLHEFQWLRLTWSGVIDESPAIYRNGTLLTITGSAGSGTRLESPYLAIGSDYSGSFGFSGIIADVRVLNYTLTDAQWATFLRAGVLPYQTVGSMVNLASPAGEFDSMTGWTVGSALTASVTSGVLSLTGGGPLATSFNNQLRGPAIFTAGAPYKIFFRARRISASGSLYVGNGYNAMSTFTPADGAWNDVVTVALPGTSGGNQDLLVLGASAGHTFEVAWVRVYQAGDTLKGLDLSEPVTVITDNGLVGLDSATGVETWPRTRPERITLRTQVAMTADGFLNADRPLIPAGYAVMPGGAATNTGGEPANITLKYGSSGGVTIGTANPTNGGAASITISNAVGAALSAQKIHVSGISGYSNVITITLPLQRIS